MSLRINQNVTSLSTYSNLNKTSSRVDSSIKKLSSGLRINSAADDAAGLAISEKMRSQIKGLSRARLNAQDGVSMLQSAEGGLNETESIIQRMRELAIQGSNDTLTTNDRLEIQKEINQLRDAIDDIADTTEFNTKKLLNGSQTAIISSSSKSVKGIVNGSNVNGGDFSVSMAVIQGGISQMQTSQIFTEKDTGNLAKGNTKLQDIAQFYDENGIFALETQQKLTMTGNAKTAEFTLDGQMTLNDLASALQNAIAGANGLAMKNSTATIISTIQSKVSGLGGYLQITSGAIGEVGDFSIAGDQAVIDALGMTVSRESANNLVQVNMKDNAGNSRKVTTSTDRAAGLLDGIDLSFASTAAQVAGHGGIVDGIKFGSVQATLTFKFSIGTAEQTVTMNFDASSTYSMNGIADYINSEIAADTGNSLTGMEATVVDGQIRLSYTPTDTTSPTEIVITGPVDELGFINGTYTGFVDGDKDMDCVVQGVSLLGTVNTAYTMAITDDSGNNVTLTVGAGLTGITAVTSASGPDLVEIDSWIVSCNQALATASVAARIDAVNGSIAITSTQLGDFNRSNQPALRSRLTIDSAGTNTDLLLGYKDGTYKGSGDTNFRLHVVDNTPSFQIGANAGQNMKVNIGNMSAEALGIATLDMSTVSGAQRAISKLDKALSIVSSERSKIGAFENRMQYTISNLESAGTNLTESESRVRDLDMASEMTEFTSSQVLQQAATAMLAQANSSSQTVLQLLQ